MNKSGTIHLRDNTDYLGYESPWCDYGYGECADRPETVTCPRCLETIITFAADCAARLEELRSVEASQT